MKLQAKINDNTAEVEIVREGDGLFARVDDREYELQVRKPESGVYLMTFGNEIFEVAVSESGIETHAQVRGKDVTVSIADPRQLRGSSDAGGDAAGGNAEIKTAMPGKVVKLIANVGDTLSKGDAVIVVEAMKMQNELRASKDGVVKEIRVTEGQTVAAGEVLAVIE